MNTKIFNFYILEFYHDNNNNNKITIIKINKYTYI